MKKTVGRILVLALVALLTLATLTGCVSSNKKVVTLSIKDGYFGVDNKDLNGLENLSATELKSIAEMMVSTFSDTDFDNREMLVAAYRGYDMLASDFKDSEIKESAEDAASRNKGEKVNLKAAVAVIDKANERAADDKALKTKFYEDMTASDLKLLIGAFQTNVEIAAGKGFLDTLLVWIGTFLGWLTNTLCFGSYIAGICLFAVIIEILMIPFAIKQQKNSIRQASLRPKEMAIKKKYKGRNDQVTMQKMQQEIQELYQRENFSPYSGCLPLLIQLPIIMALYAIVIDPMRYVLGQSAGMSEAITAFVTAAKAAGGLGSSVASTSGTIVILSEIKDVSIEALQSFLYFSNGGEVFETFNGILGSIPKFTILGQNFGLAPSFERFDVLLLVPVLTFVTYFLTSKLNRKFMVQPATNDGIDAKQAACSNNIMDISMPMMSTFFTFMVPALVGVYWMFRSLVGLGKQFIISRIMPLPTFTEEDYRKAEKEMAGKRLVKKSHSVGKVRSLHHIDDEDFEDTRERALARKAAIEEREREEQQKKAKNTPFEAASIKEDRKKKGNAEDPAETENSADQNEADN
ncbi:MAG: membrane protein insertase YidC [Clostridia bacterium]|nr:membrane protein insertase YidC [Clostridia bacterium]